MILRFIILLIISFYCTKTFAYSVFSYDIKNDEVLLAREEFAKIYPASITKIMTSYLAFDELSRGNVGIYDNFQISYQASTQKKVSAGLKYGDNIALKNALLLANTMSANDAAYVVAEAIDSVNYGGNFIQKMNEKSKQIKLYNTNFANPTGFHNDEQYSTAQDLAMLMLAIVKEYPGYIGIFNSNGFFYNGRLYLPRNKVGMNYKCIKAYKTGFTSASGYNIIAYISCGEYNVITSLINFRTGAQRDDYLVKMLDYSTQKIGEKYTKNEQKFYFENNENKFKSHTLDFITTNLAIINTISGNNIGGNTELALIRDIFEQTLMQPIKQVQLSILPLPRVG